MPSPLTRRAFLSSAAPLALAQRPARPLNLVFILADDLGWRDVGFNGSRFLKTPNIDRLAARGMRFNNAYAANPLCSPTRSSIQTGLYPARLGITTPVGHIPEVQLEKRLMKTAPPTQPAIAAESVNRLKLEYQTLAETLKSAGYATAHFGKWHLGHPPYDALHQGFDVSMPNAPVPGPAGGYLGPWKFWPEKGNEGEHIDDRLSTEAARFIDANRERPFYVNYWAFSVHSPWNGKQAYIDAHKPRVDPKDPQHNPLYAAMVQSLDEAVGRLLDAVDRAGVADRTVLVFFSDNGGWIWRANPQGNMHKGQGLDDTPVTSNLPLRGGKATLYEGGTREPCAVVWPGRVKPGSVSDEVISSIDFYPTLLEMTGVTQRPPHEFDGISFVPALRGGRLGRDSIFCHFPHYTPATGGTAATWVRNGDWKLIRFYCAGENGADRLELYNLRTDIGETTDLAAREPARVKALNAKIDAFLRDTEAVIPVRNPAYRAAAK